MRRKITMSFLGVIIISTLLIIILTFLGMYYFFFSKDNIAGDYPPNFTLGFDLYIESNNNKVAVTEKGKELLKQKNAWIQILDTNGNETYELYKPEEAPSHYSPASIVHYHMYSGTIDGYTLFVAGTNDERNLSYIIGFPSTVISKHTFEYDSNTPVLIAKMALMVLLISFFVFLIMGYVFGSRLTNPIVHIIEGVELLSQKKYIVEYEEEGIYGNVFRSLNNLTENLKLSERERIKTEKMREEWISNISHDLITPLSSIKGYSEVLADADYKISDKDIINYANIILNKTNYMEEMIFMEEVLIDDNMVFDIDNLKGFLNDTSSFGFIAKENNKIIGFAYCYTLLRPDGKTMFYLHSIGMLPNYQDKGYGSKLLSFIKEYSKEIGCSEMFLITDKGNPRACHVYEKLGGKNDYKDEIVYVYDYEKGDK